MMGRTHGWNTFMGVKDYHIEHGELRMGYG